MSALPKMSSVRLGVKRPEVREASFDDYEQIAALEATVNLTPRSRNEWLHLWQDNPACRQIHNWPIGWVLEDEDHRIVGSIGNVPQLYSFGGRTYVGATFRGWAVDERYRAFSLMLLAHQLQHPQVDLQLVTTAGPMPQAVFTRLGWSRVPVGQWDRAAFWVTNRAGAVQCYLQQKAPEFMPGLIGPLLQAHARLAASLSKLKFGARSGFELGWCSGFDARFERFWKELHESRPSVFLSCRTAETMKWHFRAALEQDRLWILIARDGPRLAGYAILLRKDTQSLSLSRMVLVDLQTLGGNPALASAMISWALDRCRREHIHVLENTGCWIEELQPGVGRPPHRRGLEAWCYLYKPTNPELAAVLQNPASWYPTQYDGDASL